MASSGDIQKRRAWERRFARYRAGGLSVVRFCEQERVSTHTFYYWAKRLKAGSACVSRWPESASRPEGPSARSSSGGNAGGAVVQFRGAAGVEVLVPADCLEAIRCLAECLAKAGSKRAEAFQEVVVKA